MLVFIDESGHPHPNSDDKRPVVVAVCIEAEHSRLISGRIHSLKRDMLNKERFELKGSNLLNTSTFRRRPDYANFAEEFFSTILDLPLTVFAVVMEALFVARETDDNYLPNRFRYLVQRVQLLAEEKDKWLPSCSTARQTYTKVWDGSSIAPFTGLTREGPASASLTLPPLWTQ